MSQFLRARRDKIRGGAPGKAIAVGLLALLLLVLPAVAQAHPLGNFTINRFSRVEPGADGVHLTYIVDMAEVPAFRERQAMDDNGDGAVSDAEAQGYLAEQVERFQPNLRLTINEQPLTLTLDQSKITFPAGQAELPTVRMTMQFIAALPAGEEAVTLDYRDGNFPKQLGWQEIVVQPRDGVNLLESSAPSESISNELRTYPDDLLQEPLAESRARVRFVPVASGVSAAGGDVEANPLSLESAALGAAAVSDPFTELINLPELGLGTVLVALLAAFGWGAAHALSPGHGKTLVGAYLVGSRGTMQHALFLGATTTLTHTAGVFTLGFITLFASQFILPETLYPWLSLLSGLLVVVIGLSMTWTWARGRGAVQEHNHEHGGEHGDEHGGQHGGETGYHRHGLGPAHSHAVPGQGNAPITWRGLLALGVSGGLLPCPSALVVMLGAIALGRIGFGLLLIVAFSLGLAGVLTGIGIALVHAGKLFERVPASGRLLRWMPVASAVFITVVGAGIALRAALGLV